MRYKIVVASYNCPDMIARCLDSIAIQNHSDFDVCVVDDASTDPTQRSIITEYAEMYGWKTIFNSKNMGALYSQVAAIEILCDDPDDVIVFVDGDDALNGPNVLKTLDRYYATGVDLTYGQYKPVPYSDTCILAKPYPKHVSEQSSFRQFATNGGGLFFNHLRTFKYKLFQHLSVFDFKFRRTGKWFKTCTDTALMIPCLELAGPNHAFIPEVLYLYTSDNPISDWRVNRRQIEMAHRDILYRKPPKACLYVKEEANA